MAEQHELNDLGNSEKIYNKKYRKVSKNSIGSGTFGSVYVVENIFNKKRFAY